MKMKYGSPNILEEATGEITLTVSQLAALGVSDVAGWEEWWADAQDFVVFEDFNVNDPNTWPEGFDLSDSNTWDILIGFND